MEFGRHLRAVDEKLTRCKNFLCILKIKRIQKEKMNK